jgi:iron complex transport system substrate-binding protein
LGDQLVGVSHECDFPPDVVGGKPVVTSSILPAAHPHEDEPLLSAREIDERVREARESGESLYRIDNDLLRDLKPDLVLTQGLCGVCAVTHQAVVAAVDALGGSARVLDLAPTNLAGVIQTIRDVGAATDKNAEAAALAEQMQGRWDRVREQAAQAPERPRTLLLEWPDPPFSAGHWNPELLALANGAPAPWDTPGQPSRTLSWPDIHAFAPEVIVLIACGLDADRAIDEAYALPEAAGLDAWFDLPAVQNAECYAVDGSAYFNRPGPRLAESGEILATILHPETFTEMLPPHAVRQFPPELVEREKYDALMAEVAAELQEDEENA